MGAMGYLVMGVFDMFVNVVRGCNGFVGGCESNERSVDVGGI